MTEMVEYDQTKMTKTVEDFKVKIVLSWTLMCNKLGSNSDNFSHFFAHLCTHFCTLIYKKLSLLGHFFERILMQTFANSFTPFLLQFWNPKGVAPKVRNRLQSCLVSYLRALTKLQLLPLMKMPSSYLDWIPNLKSVKEQIFWKKFTGGTTGAKNKEY